jgi:hypothetical protein
VPPPGHGLIDGAAQLAQHVIPPDRAGPHPRAAARRPDRSPRRRHPTTVTGRSQQGDRRRSAGLHREHPARAPALSDRLHGLILAEHPDADLVLSCQIPTYKVGKRRLYLGRGSTACRSAAGGDRDACFSARHADLKRSSSVALDIGGQARPLTAASTAAGAGR